MKTKFNNRQELLDFILDDNSFDDHFVDTLVNNKKVHHDRFVWTLWHQNRMPESNKGFMKKLGIFKKFGFLLKDKRVDIVIEDLFLHITIL